MTRPAAGTHVLHWVPGYVTSTGCGAWELQGAADYQAGQPGGRDPVLDVPRDAAAADLATWAAGQLGYPVELQAAATTISTFSLRPLAIHVGHEPAYHVRPAASQDR
jgi:hypothetical protein